jgi:hypothetical protein
LLACVHHLVAQATDIQFVSPHAFPVAGEPTQGHPHPSGLATAAVYQAGQARRGAATQSDCRQTSIFKRQCDARTSSNRTPSIYPAANAETDQFPGAAFRGLANRHRKSRSQQVASRAPCSCCANGSQRTSRIRKSRVKLVFAFVRRLIRLTRSACVQNTAIVAADIAAAGSIAHSTALVELCYNPLDATCSSDSSNHLEARR